MVKYEWPGQTLWRILRATRIGEHGAAGVLPRQLLDSQPDDTRPGPRSRHGAFDLWRRGRTAIWQRHRGYSCRKANIGSTFTARRAGRYAAINARLPRSEHAAM
jgi:hypothetical protein